MRIVLHTDMILLCHAPLQTGSLYRFYMIVHVKICVLFKFPLFDIHDITWFFSSHEARMRFRLMPPELLLLLMVAIAFMWGMVRIISLVAGDTLTKIGKDYKWTIMHNGYMIKKITYLIFQAVAC